MDRSRPDRSGDPQGDAETGEFLTTPFRRHLEHCVGLDLHAQLEECADYIQHVELLVSEFLESYYLVERLWTPTTQLAEGGDEEGELILESFYESQELEIVDTEGARDGKLVCLSGAVSPLPAGQHPALSRRGLDFVGLLDGSTENIVLGVAQASKDETPFLLLLRALNALAELSPPLRVVQLGREILRDGIPETADFTLHLGLVEPGTDRDSVALGELTRDLAEAFHRHASEVPQLSGMLRGISALDVDPDALAEACLTRFWCVPAPMPGLAP